MPSAVDWAHTQNYWKAKTQLFYITYITIVTDVMATQKAMQKKYFSYIISVLTTARLI